MQSKMRVLVTAVLLTGYVSAQVNGTVAGTVLDETGKALAKAKVHIAEKDVLVMHRIVQYNETDDDGHFHIGHVPWGTYVVMAGKEDTGYADTTAVFYSNLAVPTVTISPDSPSADVIVRLGPKAGVLELDPVTDTTTGKEIRSASITLKRAENPNFFISTSAAVGRILIPPLTEVLLEITAEGYRPWPPPDQEAEGKLMLKPEELRKLRVALQPDPARIANEKK